MTAPGPGVEGERGRLQALLAERSAAPVRRAVVAAIARVEPGLAVESTAGPTARAVTDRLLHGLPDDWWQTRRAVVTGAGRSDAVAAASVWLRGRAGVAVVLGSCLDAGPFVVPGVSAAALDALLAADGEELWFFPPGDEALLVEVVVERAREQVDVWVVPCGRQEPQAPVSATGAV